MEKEIFQKQILSQIRLTDLVQSLVNYQDNKAAATQKIGYILGSAILNDADDANTINLMRLLLDRCKIPVEMLDIIRFYTQIGKTINTDTWDYFYNYSFTGKVESKFQVQATTMDPAAKPILSIIGEDVIIDILTSPMNVLIGFIEHMCGTWKPINAMGAATYYLPKHHSELFLFIEAHVADYYGAMNAFDVGVQKDGADIFMGYRFVGIREQFPLNLKLHDVAKQTASRQAKSTLS